MPATSQKPKSAGPNRPKWDRVALLVAQEELSQRDIAKVTRISRSTLQIWLQHPEFNALVGDYKGQIIADALRLPIAKKHERIKQLNDLNEAYWQIKSDRAERHRQEREDTAGNAARAVFGDVTPAEAETGMLVAQPKIAANGKTVVEWAFDKSLDSAIKETHRQAAQELGQWQENVNLNHTGLTREYVIVDGDDE